MKKNINQILFLVFVSLAFAAVVSMVNYTDTTYAQEPVVKIYSHNNLSSSLTTEKKQNLIEQARFWGIPEEITKYVN